MLAGDGDANLFTIAVFKFNKSSTADVLIPQARAEKSYRNKSEFVSKEVFVLRVYESYIDIVRGKNNDHDHSIDQYLTAIMYIELEEV